jgi:hypothetical protein
MEKKKLSFAHFCAYLSLAISITMLVLWCCNVGGFSVVSLDSFVGVIVALLAIVVTLVLGWQIYNSIELKAKIEELNVIKGKLSVQEKDIKIRNSQMSLLIFGSLADIELYNNHYITAFRYLMTSLEYSMSLDTPENINTIFSRMNRSISKIPQDALCPAENMEYIQDSNKNIRKSKCYDIIKNQYEEIYKSFISKVKQK